jgi:hypothetical protein
MDFLVKIYKHALHEIQDVNGQLHLNKDHAYYYQVQCQLLVSEIKLCDFVVWTTKDFLVERIMFDHDLCWGVIIHSHLKDSQPYHLFLHFFGSKDILFQSDYLHNTRMLFYHMGRLRTLQWGVWFPPTWWTSTKVWRCLWKRDSNNRRSFELWIILYNRQLTLFCTTDNLRYFGPWFTGEDSAMAWSNFLIFVLKHSQRMNDSSLNPWLVIARDGSVVNAHCNCKAGIGEICSHIGALLFSIEAAIKIRNSKTVSEEKAYWMLSNAVNKVGYKSVRDIDFTSAKLFPQKRSCCFGS